MAVPGICWELQRTLASVMTAGLQRPECEKSLSKVILNITRADWLFESSAAAVAFKLEEFVRLICLTTSAKRSGTIVPDTRHTPTQAPKFMPYNIKKKKDTSRTKNC